MSLLILKKIIMSYSFLIGLSVIFLIHFHYSCTPVYIPTAVNTPLFSEKGEFQAGGSSSLFSSTDFHTSYSLTNNLGVIGNGSYFSFGNLLNDSHFKSYFFDIGLGYYKKIDRNSVFETFAGCGAGRIEGDFIFNEHNIKLSPKKFYIYPTLGHFSKYFDSAFSMRFLSYHYFFYNSNNIDFFVEPVATGKIGYKNLKFNIQIGYSFKMDNNEFIVYYPLMFSFGAQINFKNKKYNEDLEEPGFFK